MKHSARMIPAVALLLAVLLSWGLLQAGIPSDTPVESLPVSSLATESVVSEPNAPLFSDSSFRAVWVPYFDLDLTASSVQHFGAFKAQFDSILQTACAAGLNTVIVHVHPFSDVFYRSAYFPWSHLLTGIQGSDPGYDAMAYMVEATHNAGLSFHAWINPLRISTLQTPATLASNHPRNRWLSDSDPSNDLWSVATDTGIYLNPGYAEVRQYIIDWVSELVGAYAVDAIHMDDYFYPTEDASFDSAAYAQYCASVRTSPLSLLEWRTDNINQLVRGLYQAIHAQRETTQFGISPQGNLENCEKAGADVRTWASQSGYVDYLCPQIYYNEENPAKPFTETAEQWRSLTTCDSVTLYAGLALYKAGDPEVDNGTWNTSGDTIRKQLETLSQGGYSGFALYSYSYLTAEQTVTEMEQILACLGALKDG